MNFDLTRCDKSGNTCPSRHICQRHTLPVSGETLVASLNSRREAGASSCDMFLGSVPSTFAASEQVQP